MIFFPVTCESNSIVKYLGLDSGLIDFERGIDCIVSFYDDGKRLVDRKTYYLKGDEFHAWIDGTDGHKAFVQSMIVKMDCKPRPIE